ncbi:MAG TPA: hypothetical protein VE685_02555 [Thermoanaerobaculia bacterium]|nr:hypothetical protein [Thermoanaerobaculia bacterium]
MQGKIFGWSSWALPSDWTPWGDRPSLYEYIQAHVEPGRQGLTEGGETLPDEDEDVKGIHWAAGAFDGAFGHHGGGASEADTAQEILAALRAVLAKASRQNLERLYPLLAENSALEYVDPLLEGIAADSELDPERLRAVARWIATRGADRNAVKAAMALLGLFPGEEDRGLLLTLGRHEELTLYAAVALANALPAPDETLWELGRNVQGWGRIQVVERLAKTRDPRIRRWLLVEGYRNSVMVEYTAAICARAGGLRAELGTEEPAEEVLASAGDLLVALIEGEEGPSEGIASYEDGAAVTEHFLEHLRFRTRDLDHFLAVDRIRTFLMEEEIEWGALERFGWTPEHRERLLRACDEILARPGWKDLARQGLASGDRDCFFTAARVAENLGLDPWEEYFRRLQEGDSVCWYHVMRTDDPERIDRVLALAQERIPLQEIATGPADELGLGPGFAEHTNLDWILQDLRRFPGRGWPLLRAGLRSPVVRNRNMALQALAAWGRERWEPETEMLLRRALRDEPDEGVRERIEKVLAGRPLEEED